MIKTAVFIFIVMLAFVSYSAQKGIFSTYHPKTEIVNSSMNPPAAKTGAPGEGNCTSCHSGSIQSPTGIIDISFSGAGNEYVVGQNYSFTISTSSGAKNGFQATILSSENTKAGDFTSGTNYSIATLSGRQYARHSTSAGITTWTVNWTAPAEDAGDLTLYYSFVKSNNMGNTSGDLVYLGQFNLQSAIFNTITPYEKTGESLRVYYDASQKIFKTTFELSETDYVLFQVYSLDGKLITTLNPGLLSAGKYQYEIFVDADLVPGIYAVSVFIGNMVYTHKIPVQND
ncbi:MAG: hypothetical protein IPM74_12745 [Crocinitomicaceae bacterium]|nr:hypothetical protein [Crocinitomicaceae bacterium]MBK8926743.1 hypothetical protein [Crocinitomicaceae bacterium]